MLDGVCLQLDEMLRGTERRKRGLLSENLYLRTLNELIRRHALRNFVRCVRELGFEERNRVIGGDIRVLFVKSGFIRGGLCPTE